MRTFDLIDETRRPDVNDRLMTPSEVAEYLGVAERTLDQWRYRREGPDFLKPGGAVRYRRVDVDRWLDGRLVSGDSR